MFNPTGVSYATKVEWLRAAISVAITSVNLIGTAVVFCLTALVVPLPHPEHAHSMVANLTFSACYLIFAMSIGIARGLHLSSTCTEWIRSQREPTERERYNVLRMPRRLSGLVMTLWALAGVLVGVYNAMVSLALGILLMVIVLMAGLSTSAVTYLVVERLQRPFARLALERGVLSDRIGMRLGLRTVLAWFLGTGVSLLGITLAGITAFGLGDEISAHRLALTMMVLGGVTFVFGGFTTWLAAKASSDPVRALRRSVSAVQAGDFSVDVPIYDGTELGILQAGFNDMLHGLRERETMRDLFGRHVGTDVARAALATGVNLGGEVRRVGVLFVDIVGSTAMASNRPAEEVVTVLNRFFHIVIEVVDRHGGSVNKFEGDAALAIWGAPTAQPDVETSVLRAARELGTRLAREIPELRAGIGASIGNAVAGNIGAAQRYEYTVIGDPVNEAARLTELAKDVPALVMANGLLLDAAPAEVDYWHRLSPVVVRGRTKPTSLATPFLSIPDD